MAGLCGFSLADQSRSWTPLSKQVGPGVHWVHPCAPQHCLSNMRACGVPVGINLRSNFTAPSSAGRDTSSLTAEYAIDVPCPQEIRLPVVRVDAKCGSLGCVGSERTT
jgi:hypothetical protein